MWVLGCATQIGHRRNDQWRRWIRIHNEVSLSFGKREDSDMHVGQQLPVLTRATLGKNSSQRMATPACLIELRWNFFDDGASLDLVKTEARLTGRESMIVAQILDDATRLCGID